MIKGNLQTNAQRRHEPTVIQHIRGQHGDATTFSEPAFEEPRELPQQ